MEDETIVSRAILYSFFETGDIPTQEEFADLINSYVHRREDGVFIFEPGEEIKRFGVGIPQPAYRLGVRAEGETEKLISLHDLNENHKWSVNLNPEAGDNRGLNIAQETVEGSISRLFIQDASGNVGIGTLYPEQKVHIETNSPSSTTGIKLLNTATVENNGWIVGHVNEVETARDGGLSFQSQLDESIERMLITTCGNVGINEPSPYTKLHVSMSNSDPKAVIALDETTGIVNIGPITENIVMDFRGIQARAGEFIGDVLDIETSALNLQRLGGGLLIHGDPTLEESKKLIVTDDGCVGVGTTTPSEKIDVNGAIKLGDTETLNEGTIRWTGEDFQGYDGLTWESMTGKGPYLKGGTYIFVKGLGTPLENGVDLTEAVNEANELSNELNTRILPLEDVQEGWYVEFRNGDISNYGGVVSISADEIVLAGNVQDYAGRLPLPFIIRNLDFYPDDITRYRIILEEEFPVVSDVIYDPDRKCTIYNLSTPLPEHLSHQVREPEAVRVQVIVAPGQYLLSESLVLSDDYVDLISITGNPDVELNLTDDNFYTGIVNLTEFGGGIFNVVNDPFVILSIDEAQIDLNFVLSIEASCYVKGIRTKKHYSETFQAVLNLMIDDEMEMEMSMESYFGRYNYPLPIDVKPTDDHTRTAPTVENCHGGNYSFGINLFDEENLVIDGTYINNQALLASFGYRCELWGTYENNKGEYSFAFQGVASGRFINNTGRGRCFGGGDGEAWGEFINCQSGDRSFGGNIASGTFTNCTADQDSFGSGEALYGKLYYCRLTWGTFPIVSGSGRTVYCIDGNNEHNNQ